jgi:hypothetical protein
MTIDDLSLFDAADVVADLMLTVDCGYDAPADDQLMFRFLQKRRLPHLSPADFQNDESSVYRTVSLGQRERNTSIKLIVTMSPSR